MKRPSYNNPLIKTDCDVSDMLQYDKPVFQDEDMEHQARQHDQQPSETDISLPLVSVHANPTLLMVCKVWSVHS